MKNEIKLIASDIDGTLINDENKLPDNFYKLLEELEKRNIIFVAASGRSTQSIQFAINKPSDNLYFISNNGAILEHGGKISYANKFTKKDIEVIMDSFRQSEEVSIFATSSTASYVEKHPDHCSETFNDYFYNLKIVDNINKVEDDIVKISMYSEDNSMENFELESTQSLKDKYFLVKAGAYFIDIMRDDSNKGNALEILLKQLDIHQKNTIGFGDYPNDIHMLEVVGKSYAMKEAHPDVRLMADEIIGSNNDNSVIKKIIDLLNLDI